MEGSLGGPKFLGKIDMQARYILQIQWFLKLPLSSEDLLEQHQKRAGEAEPFLPTGFFFLPDLTQTLLSHLLSIRKHTSDFSGGDSPHFS